MNDHIFRMAIKALFITFLLFNASKANQNLIHVPQPDGDEVTVTEDQDPAVVTEKFVATREWQIIKEGQSIPRGLHVRMNLQTGLKEAKLLEEKVPESQHDNNLQKDIPSAHHRIGTALEEALKNIATSHDEPSGNKENVGVDAQRKFRSIEEIQSEFAEKNITMSSEMELLSGIYEELLTPDRDSQSLLAILDDVEFYSHNLDNAIYFADLGGMDLLTKLLNESADVDVLASVAICIGSAAQSNEYVAERVMAGNSLPVILRHLQDTESSDLVQRLLFSISSLIRTKPDILQIFTDLGGQNLLRSIIKNGSKSAKAKTKVFTLVADVLQVEREEIRNLISDELKLSLCESLAELLSQSQTNMDIMDKLLRFYQIVADKTICPEKESSSLDTILSSLEKMYKKEADNPDEDVAHFNKYMLHIVESSKRIMSEKPRVSERLEDEL